MLAQIAIFLKNVFNSLFHKCFNVFYYNQKKYFPLNYESLILHNTIFSELYFE